MNGAAPLYRSLVTSLMLISTERIFQYLSVSASGTQRVIFFLRQIVEHGGFYRTSDQTLDHSRSGEDTVCGCLQPSH